MSFYDRMAIVLSKRAGVFVAVILVITAIMFLAFIAAVVVFPAILALTVRKPPESAEPEASPATSEG
jgi:hypothetical protein